MPKKPAAGPITARQSQVQRNSIKAACMTSLLYDIAGRSEDAFNLTWERIEFIEGGGGYAHLA